MKNMNLKEALEAVEAFTCFAENMLAKEPAGINCTECFITRADIEALNIILDHCAEEENEITEALGTAEALTGVAERTIAKEPAGINCTEIFVNKCDVTALNTILDYAEEMRA